MQGKRSSAHVKGMPDRRGKKQKFFLTLTRQLAKWDASSSFKLFSFINMINILQLTYTGKLKKKEYEKYLGNRSTPSF